MGLGSLVYSGFNSLTGILRWIWRLIFSTKPVAERSNDDKQKEAVTEPKSATWLSEKALFLSMPLSEKRVHYKCGNNYVSLSYIPTWTEYFNENKEWLQKLAIGRLDEVCEVDPELNEKISIWRGDITTLEIDAIVNAANESLLGGGGVDGVIHRAAGELLREECATLNGCKTGEAKASGGYLLPAKYVIHTVGPRGSGDEKLMNCYRNSLNIMKELHQRSVAFPCISTAIFDFPNERAANIALKTARDFLQENRDAVDRIIFCLFMPEDVEIYEVLMQKYFPVSQPQTETTAVKQSGQEEKVKETKPEGVMPEEKTTILHTDEDTSKVTAPVVTSIKEELAEAQPPMKQAEEQKEDANLKEGHAAKADSAKADSAKTVSDKDDSDKDDSDKDDSDKDDSDKTVSDKTVSDKTVSDKTVSDKADSDKADSDKADSDKADSDKADSDKAVSDKAVSDKAVSDKAVSDKAVSDKEVSDKEVSDKEVSDVMKQATENSLETSDKTENKKLDGNHPPSTLNAETGSEPGKAKQAVPDTEVGENGVKREQDKPWTYATEQKEDVLSESESKKEEEAKQENVTSKIEHSINKGETTSSVTIEENKWPKDSHEDSNVEGLEQGTGEQSDTSIMDKEEENHSLMSDLTDFEQISISEAQNQPTETNGTEEQSGKMDKNENMPPEAIAEDGVQQSKM